MPTLELVLFAFRVWRAYGYVVYTLKANGTPVALWASGAAEKWTT